MGSIARWLLLALLVLAVLLGGVAGLAAYSPLLASRLLWPALETVLLSRPFVGITTDGEPVQDLFPIKSTGISTQPVVDAARAFIDTLDGGQRQRALFPVDDLEWRRWANIHLSYRQGVGLLEMSPAQEAAAEELLAASLSSRGFNTASDIMKLEGHLADLKQDHEQYGEQRYWFTVMGEPSQTLPWGWQIDGHHLVINCFVLGDQMVMTPTFMGSEPTRADSGRYAGTEVFARETELGLALIASLTDAQRRMAVVAADKTGNNNHGELFQDNAVVPYQGLPMTELMPEQNEHALMLVRQYVGRMRVPHAEVKMAEVVRHWQDSYFAWVGGTSADNVFYYRFQSPVIMIEFDHQTPVALEGPENPTRNHVHTVVRTPNGNDYGKDLLRQHLALYPH